MPSFRVIHFKVRCRDEPIDRPASFLPRRRRPTRRKRVGSGEPGTRPRTPAGRSWAEPTGSFEDAVRTLQQGMALHPLGRVFSDWLGRALAEHALDRTYTAKAAAAHPRPRVPHPRRAQSGSGPKSSCLPRKGTPP
jgi:hypothetical protein